MTFFIAFQHVGTAEHVQKSIKHENRDDKKSTGTNKQIIKQKTN
jgi:hypothetical protein